MTSERSNHEKEKCDLNRELESVLKTAGAVSATLMSKEHLPSEITQNLCNVVEAIYIHGLRDPFFLKGSRYAKYPEPNFWPFVSKYSHKSITNQISGLNQIKSEIGKGRAWIRIILNESSLEHYLKLLLAETKAMNQFYNEWAFLRDGDQVDRMLGFVKTLSGIRINGAINSSFLNSWTPSPLILAGLATGQAVKINALALKKASTSSQPDADSGVGTTPVDYLPAVQKLSPIRPHRPVAMVVGSFSDDDASSIYSHPSMLDRQEHKVLTSTPKGEFSPLAPLLVSRRTTRPRRSSKSSSESNSKGSNKQSEAGTSRSALESETPSSLPASLPPRNLLEGAVIVEGEVFGGTAEPEKNKEAMREERVETPEVETVTGGESASNSDAASCQEHVQDEVPEEPAVEESPEAATKEPSGTSPPGETEVEGLVEDEPSQEDAEEKEAVSEGETISEEETKQEDVCEESKVCEEEDTPAEVLEATEETVCGLDIPSETNNEDSLLGTSLREELESAMSFDDVIPTGNALNRSGAWAVPRQSWDVGDGDTSGILSSSSGSSGVPVSFGQALRSAMEQHSPSTEESTEFGESIEGSPENEERKPSVQIDIDHRLTSISKEQGLPAQEYRCPMCRKSIGSPFGYGKYESCGVDGLYYCVECIKPGGMYSIPARILYSWDWEQRHVSDRGRAFLEANLERPVFKIDTLNPSLYDHVPAMKNLLLLRERLQIVSLYLFNCRESVADDFKKRVQPRDYLYNDPHMYSFMDLQNVKTGTLEKQLLGWLKHGIGHVMSCVLCRQKGFVCQICDVREIIYPFNTATTQRCPDCFSVFHSACAQASPCPKCVRRSTYDVQRGATDLPLD